MVAITDAVTETMLLYLDDQYVFSDGLYYFEDCFNTLYSFADCTRITGCSRWASALCWRCCRLPR